MAAPRRPRGRFLLLVLVLLGVTFVTLSDRSGNSGVFRQGPFLRPGGRQPVPVGRAFRLATGGEFLVRRRAITGSWKKKTSCCASKWPMTRPRPCRR